MSGRLSLASGAAALLVLVAGCRVDDVETLYGRRSGAAGGPSVNGTAVLADMFVAAGHTVETRTSLSPRLHETDTIVWFPDSFSVPSQSVIYWFEDWLASGENRTLIVVGRDFDAAPYYWQQILPSAPADQKSILADRLKEAQQDVDARRADLTDGDECSWYSVDTLSASRQVRKLSGPWSEGVDESKVEIEVASILQPPDWAQTLLAAGDDILVSRQQLDDWPDSKLILVNNGSFLLNLPLVNHEHRKLAGKLAESVATPGKVVFLESGRSGLRIDEKDPAPKMPNGLEVLAIWPMNAILLHLAVLGIIFCFARWPIFGTPIEPVTDAQSDFGQHVDALGDLLARSGNREYAERKLQTYRDSGTAPPGPAP